MTEINPEQARAAGDPMRVWTCKVGWAGDELPKGSDLPMRRAVSAAYEALTGCDPDFIFSGWAGALTEPEMAVVLDTVPSEEYAAEWHRRRVAEAGTGWETVEFRRTTDDVPQDETHEGLLYEAWGLIANANEGRWDDATPEWRAAAERWRDAWHATLRTEETAA